MTTLIRILLADDHAMFRSGIRVLLELQEDFQVVAEAMDGRDAVRKALETRPDIVLMDISMPGMDGLAACGEIKSARPDTRIILLTQYENREYILPATKLGASGYVLKRAAADELVNAIRVVHSGRAFVDPAVAQVMMEELRTPSHTGVASLTEREREVMVLMARGKTNQEIATALGMSVKTVDFHRANLMQKLGLQSRADVVRLAVKQGIVD
ncbi:MAG TPA: response regulator transcription factor [Symbiobacteriaceae bacterium]